MKNRKRSAILLLAAILSSSLAACGQEADRTPVTDEDTGTGSVQTVPADAETEDSIPALEVRDLGGRSVNILIRSEWNYEFIAEAESGDIVEDNVLKRNAAIEDRYNCTLNFIEKKGDWSNHAAFAKAIHSSVLAADGAYDFVAGYQACLATNIFDGDFMDLTELPYLTFDAPWWTKQGLEALTVNGKCYEIGGDIAFSLLEGIFCMFYNKTLAAQYDTEDLYQLVRDGAWTHEAMMRVIKGVGADLNGDSKMDRNDRFGFLTADTYIRPYLVAYDTPTLGYDTDGTLCCVWNNAHTVSVLEALLDMAYHEDVFFADPDQSMLIPMFRSSQTLLTPARLGLAAQLRDMDDDFGILPYPKFDENQAEYRTTTFNEVSMISVPVTAPDPAMSALMIEAMCREAHTTIAPAFYEQALKGKFARDEESVEMVDLIRSTLSFDCGWINSMVLDVSGAQYTVMVREKNSGFASWYASRESAIESKLDAFRDFYFSD